MDGKGEQSVRFTEGTSNATATVFFDHSWLAKWVTGYDLNITVSDVNGNEGYLEFHIDSVLEDFVQWVIGRVTALAKFVMELASAAIEWIWSAMSNLINKIMNPILEASLSYGIILISSIENGFSGFQQNGDLSIDETDNIISAFISPFFFTLLTFSMVFIIAINLISYFIPIFSWLLTGLILLIFGIMLYHITMTNESDDYSNKYSKTSIDDYSKFDEEYVKTLLLGSCYSLPIDIEDRKTESEWALFIWTILSVLFDLCTLIFIKEPKYLDIIHGQTSLQIALFCLGLATAFVIPAFITINPVFEFVLLMITILCCGVSLTIGFAGLLNSFLADWGKPCLEEMAISVGVMVFSLGLIMFSYIRSLEVEI